MIYSSRFQVKELSELFYKVINRIRKKGLKGASQSIKYILYEFYYWRIKYRATLKTVQLSEVGIINDLCHYHGYTDYLDFNEAMKAIKVNPNKDVFIDFGSGMGAVVIMAAAYPFLKIIGVEISSELNAVAQDLIRRNLKNLKCKNIDLIVTDVASYNIPDNATIFYFYNPFHGNILTTVINNIKTSLKNSPRKLTIIFKNPNYFEKINNISSWLKESRRFKGYSDHDCVIYQTYL